MRHLFLDVHQVYNTFPAEWRKLLSNTRRQHERVTDEVYIDVNRWVNVSNVTLKMLTDSLKLKEKLVLNEYLLRKHSTIDISRLTKNPFVSIRKSIKDVKIRNLNYKLLHNIYPTMHHLFKWKIKDTENCNWCNVKETTHHAIFNCEIASQAITSLAEVIKSRYCLASDVVLSYENVLFGLVSTSNDIRLKTKQKSSIDVVVTLLKQKLILQREDKTLITKIEIDNIFEERRKIEKYINTKNRKEFYINSWGLSNI